MVKLHLKSDFRDRLEKLRFSINEVLEADDSDDGILSDSWSNLFPNIYKLFHYLYLRNKSDIFKRS